MIATYIISFRVQLIALTGNTKLYTKTGTVVLNYYNSLAYISVTFSITDAAHRMQAVNELQLKSNLSPKHASLNRNDSVCCCKWNQNCLLALPLCEQMPTLVWH